MVRLGKRSFLDNGTCTRDTEVKGSDGVHWRP
jgi:hypothetical protein